MPAVSVKQRRFMGMVRAVQKGEMSAPSKEIASAASDMKKTDVKKFASTKEKELPMVKEYMVGYGAVVSSARPGATSHSDAEGKYVAKAGKKKKTVKEEAPTMSTGSTAQAAGFSGDSDPNGPTAGLDEPLGGVGRPVKGRKFKCKTSRIKNFKKIEENILKEVSSLAEIGGIQMIQYLQQEKITN